eukprot:6214494-Pleurochrysis_carterae.AAC.4
MRSYSLHYITLLRIRLERLKLHDVQVGQDACRHQHRESHVPTASSQRCPIILSDQLATDRSVHGVAERGEQPGNSAEQGGVRQL